VEFESRNARFEEYLSVLRQAWRGGAITIAGEFVSARDVVAYPPTTRQPGPPIWLGGNSSLTRRRVVRLAQGWMPLPAPIGPETSPARFASELSPLLEDLRSLAATADRTEPIDILCVLPSTAPGWSSDQSVELVERLTNMDVTWLAVNGEGSTLDEAFAFIDDFRSNVIGRV